MIPQCMREVGSPDGQKLLGVMGLSLYPLDLHGLPGGLAERRSKDNLKKKKKNFLFCLKTFAACVS